jgi:hypothetical protein
MGPRYRMPSASKESTPAALRRRRGGAPRAPAPRRARRRHPRAAAPQGARRPAAVERPAWSPVPIREPDDKAAYPCPPSRGCLGPCGQNEIALRPGRWTRYGSSHSRPRKVRRQFMARPPTAL